MITSAVRVVPSAGNHRRPGRIASIRSVTSSTFGRASAGYQSLENTTRLQPIT